MGMSRGGLDAAIAFGLEPRVHAAWIDSAPWTGLYGMIDAMIKPFTGPLLTPLIRSVVWNGAHFFSGGKVDNNLPLDLLTKFSGSARWICISQGIQDNWVPITEGSDAVRFLSGLVDNYRVHVYNPPADCSGDKHHTFMWVFPDNARTEFCHFWSEAFGRDPSACGLGMLPRYQRVDPKDVLPVLPGYSHVP